MSESSKRKRNRGQTQEGLGTLALLNGRLIAVSGSRTGCKYVLQEEVTLGRASDCDVIVDNAECSREHARIRRGESGFTIEDLGSRNGTIVNGRRIEGQHPLCFGDRVRIGPHDVFLFTPHDPIEEQLLHRQRLETLGRLTAGVAHDLNNMLGAVKASVDFIRQLPKDGRTSEEADGCLDDISIASSRAADLAGRLLSFARASGNHAPTNITDIVTEAVNLSRRTFDRTMNIEAKLEPGLHVDGDATQLHQVLMNLLVNARDASDSKGNIWLQVMEDNRKVVLKVRDDGCGMTETTRSQIFEPFYTTKRPGAGFGLGLATVADIVKSHGGEISVDSKEDEGTTFTIKLPATPKPKESSQFTTIDDVSAQMRVADGLRIALVDDEPVMRRSLARVFRRAGFKVRTFETGEEVLDLFVPKQAELPDAMILDLDLPGITGEETLRRLRRRGALFPVICISGHNVPSRQKDVMASGAAAFLGKPFEPSHLVTAVFTAIEAAGDESTAH